MSIEEQTTSGLDALFDKKDTDQSITIPSPRRMYRCRECGDLLTDENWWGSYQKPGRETFRCSKCANKEARTKYHKRGRRRVRSRIGRVNQHQETVIVQPRTMLQIITEAFESLGMDSYHHLDKIYAAVEKSQIEHHESVRLNLKDNVRSTLNGKPDLFESLNKGQGMWRMKQKPEDKPKYTDDQLIERLTAVVMKKIAWSLLDVARKLAPIPQK
jgi:hypothetical protein